MICYINSQKIIRVYLYLYIYLYLTVDWVVSIAPISIILDLLWVSFYSPENGTSTNSIYVPSLPSLSLNPGTQFQLSQLNQQRSNLVNVPLDKILIPGNKQTIPQKCQKLPLMYKVLKLLLVIMNIYHNLNVIEENTKIKLMKVITIENKIQMKCRLYLTEIALRL